MCNDRGWNFIAPKITYICAIILGTLNIAKHDLKVYDKKITYAKNVNSLNISFLSQTIYHR